jgi:hypothetical protein
MRKGEASPIQKMIWQESYLLVQQTPKLSSIVVTIQISRWQVAPLHSMKPGLSVASEWIPQKDAENINSVDFVVVTMKTELTMDGAGRKIFMPYLSPTTWKIMQFSIS